MIKRILGIDEVGRGPWAGPLVIGACVLNSRYDENNQKIESELWQNDLKDSKQLSAKKREQLELRIREKARACALGWVEAEEIDKIGLGEALKLATRRAVEQISPENFTEIIIDGTQNFLKGTKYERKVTVLKKADDKIKEVSAASILAKVARDNYMIKLAEKYPEYGFEKHVGYGTVQHKQALEKYGPCLEHRFSVKPLTPWRIKSDSQNPGTDTSTTARGYRAEQLVADYLENQGHKILARNYKTKIYEIDIVSATKDHIYFTEVKYRKNKKHGAPLEAITKEKQHRMTVGAELFMKTLRKKLEREKIPSPILAAASVIGEPPKLETWFEITD